MFQSSKVGRSVSVALHYMTVSVIMKGADVCATPNFVESHRLAGMLFVTESLAGGSDHSISSYQMLRIFDSTCD